MSQGGWGYFMRLPQISFLRWQVSYVSRWQACLAPAASTAAASAHFTAAAPTLEAASATVAFEALLAACAIDARIAALTVIAECTVVFASGTLLAVASLRLPLVLTKIWALLVLV